MKKDIKTKNNEKKATKVDKKVEEKAKAAKSKKVEPEPESSDISLSSSEEEPVAVVQPKTSKKEQVTGKREKVEAVPKSKKEKNVKKEEEKPAAVKKDGKKEKIVAEKKPVVEKKAAPVTKKVKKPVEESDDEKEEVKQISKSAKSDKGKAKVVPKKKEEEESSEVDLSSSESEPEPPKKVAKVESSKKDAKIADKKKAVATKSKKVEESEEEDESDVKLSSSSSDEVAAKPTEKPKKKAVVEKEEEDEEEEEEKEDEEKEDEEKEDEKEDEEKEDEDEKEEKKEKMEDVEEDGKPEIFMSNLPFRATEDQIAEFFGYYGEVINVKLMMRDGRPSGKGFVTFKNYKDAVASKAANGMDFQGRNIEVRLSSDPIPPRQEGFQRRDEGAPRRQRDDALTLFVGGLSYDSTRESVQSFFAHCGNIIDVRVASDQEGNPRGFAHVQFDSDEAVQNALKLSGKELDGRAIRLDAAGNKGGDRNQGSAGRFGGRPQRDFSGPRRFGGYGGGKPAGGFDASKRKGTIRPSQGTKMQFQAAHHFIRF